MIVNQHDKDVMPLALDRKQAAQALGISVRKLDQLHAGRQLPYVRIGSRVVYPLDGLRAWLAARVEGGEA